VACRDELLILCSWIFVGPKSREICCQVLEDIMERGYHLLVDNRGHRYVYEKLKHRGLVRRRRLVHIEEKKTRWALVAHKENIYSLIRTLQKIADHPTPWYYS